MINRSSKKRFTIKVDILGDRLVATCVYDVITHEETKKTMNCSSTKRYTNRRLFFARTNYITNVFYNLYISHRINIKYIILIQKELELSKDDKRKTISVKQTQSSSPHSIYFDSNSRLPLSASTIDSIYKTKLYLNRYEKIK